LDFIPITENATPETPVPDIPDIAGLAVATFADMYRASGYRPPWIGYLAIEDGACVGTCAFKTPPQDKRVEIAYFTFPENEGRGVATRMASKLIEIARRTSPEVEVFAQTLPEENASSAVLKKLGFTLKGEVIHPEDGRVWEWTLPRGE
jgi:RimJ/RimL family protein N-acetyltransferase